MGIKNHFKNHAIVHLIWIIGVLSALIVCLVSINLGKVDGIKDILSFAVSFASLLLALIAIAQSAFSGSATTEALGSVNSAASQIESSTKNFLELAGSIPESITRIEESIRKPAEDVLSAAQDLAQHSSDIKGTAGSILRAQSDLFAKSAKEPEANEIAENNEATEFGKMSPLDALCVYISMQAAGTGMPINLRELTSNRFIPSHMSGVFSALIFTNLITTSEYENDRITIEAQKFSKNQQAKALKLVGNSLRESTRAIKANFDEALVKWQNREQPESN